MTHCQKFIKYFSLATILFFALSVHSQEINCRIQVNSSQVQGSNKSVYEELQKALFEFLNNQIWTNHIYTIEERIECSFLLNITNAISADEFKGTLQITSTRPVFQSAYDSPMVNIMDKNIQFRYAEGQALEYSETSHDELTALFAFYVYYIIGIDYDSFSSLGGTPFFEKAEKIVSTAQSSPYVGWKSFESKKNRYWLIEQHINPQYSAVREYSYSYHRLALDIMHNKPADARTNIAADLSPLLKVHQQKRGSYIMQVFFDAKSDEIVNILSESYTTEATRAYNILKQIDPGHLSKYEKIIKKQ